LAGGFSAVAGLWLMTNHGGDFEHARWLAFTALVCGQAVRAYANRSLRMPIHSIPANRVLLAAGLAVIAVQAAIPYVPPLAAAFRASRLDLLEWGLAAAIALAPAILAEVVRSARRAVWVA